jgi:hypothetical protein
MAQYDYNQVIQELMDQEAVPDNEICKFEFFMIADVFQNYFQFCQEHLSETCLGFGYPIQPARMYFASFHSVNAGARRGQNYSIIKVHMGSIQNLHDLFSGESLLEDPRLSEYREFDQLLRATQTPPFEFLLFQTGTLFTYYHELGHLIQVGNAGHSLAETSEQYSAEEEAVFDPHKHILEFDADQFAANQLAQHVIHFIGKFGALGQEEATLKKLVVNFLVGVMGYIIFLWATFNEDIYYDRFKHPHPVIRILWIVPIIIETVKIKFPQIDSKALLGETMRVLDIYLENKGEGQIRDRFIDRIYDEYDHIMGYAAEMMSAAQAIPYLCVNTVLRNH